jgi:phage nucleotide-binding protein
MLITNTNQVHSNGIKCLIYGESGVGKTSLVKTINEPTLIISAESGLLSIAGSNIDVFDLNQYDNLEKKIASIGEVYRALNTQEYKEKYKCIFIDSITEISQQLVQFLKTKYPDKRETLVMWGEYSEKIKQMIKAFRDLQGYDVVFTALRSVEKDDIGRRYFGVDMNGKISKQIEALVDELFCLEVIESEDGEKKRVLITNRTDQYSAKDRSGKLNQYEPSNLGLVFNKIKGVENV